MRILLCLLLVLSVVSVSAFDNVYFGLIHSHSDSYGDDGHNTYLEAVKQAKENGLDFFAVSPHTHTTVQQGIDIHAELRKMVNDIEHLNNKMVNDNFVLLIGQEWGVLKKGGHIGIYGLKDAVPIVEKDFDGFYKWAENQPDMFLQFNHPRWEHFGERHTPARDRTVTTIELFTGPGHSPSGPAKNRFDTYLEFLNRGWHIGPSSSQDNHKGAFASANDIRIGVLANELSYDSVMDAFLKSRTFATEDKNLKMRFYAKSGEKTFWMGEAIDMSELVGNSSITLFAETEDGNGENNLKFEVFYDEGAEGNWAYPIQSFKGNKIKMEITGEMLQEGGVFFVRASQEDSDVAVSAPIWIGSNEHVRRTVIQDFFKRIPYLVNRTNLDSDSSASDELQNTIDSMSRSIQRQLERQETQLLKDVLNGLLEITDRTPYQSVLPMLKEIVANITVNTGDDSFQKKLDLIVNN